MPGWHRHSDSKKVKAALVTENSRVIADSGDSKSTAILGDGLSCVSITQPPNTERATENGPACLGLARNRLL